MTYTRRSRRGLMIAGLGLSALFATGAVAPVATAEATGPGTGQSSVAETAASPGSGPASSALDRQALARTLEAVHEAGMYGVYSSVRDRWASWDGAAGVADVETRRPVKAKTLHRVGSITKTFTAVAILQQVEKGRIDLDAPVARYRPALLPPSLGQKVTVRMLLNHTSGIGDYVLSAFPSLASGSAASLDEHRFRDIPPRELVRLGVKAQPTGAPGERWSYSNTNYVILGLLLETVTGADAETYITENVIRRAGLRDTFFPRGATIPGRHSRAYESFYGFIDPPRDYSVYDMSWASTAGAIVSTTADLDRFYRQLLGGGLLPAAQLEQMRTTVPVTNEQGEVMIHYGLGIYAQDLPCGRFWGHDGAVFGMGTLSLSSPDGNRQISLGHNLMKYQRFDDNGVLQPHPIDFALGEHVLRALCGSGATAAKGAPFVPFPTQQVLVKR
ncbi:serine hydrolase domain-containing protein [Streptosporangium carneum]|uniref:Hydrolase n=1 Tax=Streptosporangium carneum TaxID=47481 RepID=A0A9W6I4L4_9ACTN|nr:serine hydrolase domain-containing protein [Streptosporangium carneum]GLK10865.1 hydrolase [Streptosporangium carneum]